MHTFEYDEISPSAEVTRLDTHNGEELVFVRYRDGSMNIYCLPRDRYMTDGWAVNKREALKLEGLFS